MAVGIWVSVDGPSFLKIFGPLSSSAMQFVNVGYFLIAAGAILFALGFLGCYGAHSENKCALMMFFLVLLLIFIAEVAAAVVALVYTTMVRSGIGQGGKLGRIPAGGLWPVSGHWPPSLLGPKHWPVPPRPSTS